MKKIFKYTIPSIITFIILGIVFYINDLYPFGSKLLIQVDTDYIYVPIMCKIWDFLHYGGSIFYTNLGFGNSIYGPLMIQGSLFSPLNLLLLLIKRDDIISFFGIFIIIKLCLVSLTSYIYINNKYSKINNFYKIIFSILYTFSGFFLLNYFNIIWLDVIILFPLLVMYLDRILNNRDEVGYIIILAISFIITFYFSFFIVIFILLYSAVNLYFSDRRIVKSIIFKLGKSTLIAFLISAFSSLPLIYQIFTSSRFGYMKEVSLFNNLPMKSLYVLFSPLFIVLLFKLVFKIKKNNKNVEIYKYIILVLLYIIPLFFDPVNMMMHGGSYWSFPYRYGFIVTFILMDAGLYYIDKYDRKYVKKYNIWNILYFVMINVFLLVIIYLGVKYIDKINNNGGILLKLDNMSVYKGLMYMVVAIFIGYIFCLLFENNIIRYLFLSVVSACSIFLFAKITIYHNPGYFLCTNAFEMKNNMTILNDGRYKVDYGAYTPYYGLIFSVDTLDNWLHLVPKSALDAYDKLGYYFYNDMTYSQGGTIFTDWLLNFKYVFTLDKRNDDMFTYVDDYKNKMLYKINYGANYGLLVDDIVDIDEDDKFEYQNKLYNNLFNNNKEIVQYKSYDFKGSDYIEFDYDVGPEEGYLYFYSKNSKRVDYAIVNDEYVYSFDDCIKYFGNHSGVVNIKIRLKKYQKIDFELGFIKKKDILELNSFVKYKNNKYYVDSAEEKYLVIPINNIPGLSVYNNNVKVDKYKYLNNFIAIKINSGKNVISLRYRQPLLNVGILLSVIGILLLIFYKRIIPNAVLLNICYYLYISLIAIMLIYIYIYSFFKYLG